MKKLLLLILSLFLFTFSYAINFDLNNDFYIEDNTGVVQLPSINIDFGDKTYTGFDINIKKQSEFIFYKSGTGTLSQDHKTLSFSGNYTGKLSLTGIYIRVYDEDIYDKLYLKLDNKTYYSSKSIHYDHNRYRYDDKTLPLPPTHIYYKFTKDDKIKVSFDSSPDLNVLYYVVRIYRNNNFYRDIKVSGLSYIIPFIKDFKNYHWSIEVFSKSKYFLSSGVKLDIKKPILQANTTNTGSKTTIKKTDNIIKKNNSKTMCIQMLQSAKDPKTGECKIFPTPCDVPSGWIKVNSCKVSLFEKREKFIFKTKLFNTFEEKFDKKIEKIIKNIEDKEKLLEVRNGLLQTLKNYEDKTYTKQKTIQELKKYVIEFIYLLKN